MMMIIEFSPIGYFRCIPKNTQHVLIHHFTGFNKNLKDDQRHCVLYIVNLGTRKIRYYDPVFKKSSANKITKEDGNILEEAPKPISQVALTQNF
jgi:hypothetical protein